MKMNKQRFRIGELALNLEVESFVIRFWEKEFNIKAIRSEGGQRFYDNKHLLTFKKIKELLYEKKFTIAGAKEALKSEKNYTIGAQKTTMDQGAPMITARREFDHAQLQELKIRLLALRKLL